MSLKPWQTWIDSEYSQRRDLNDLKDQGQYTADDVQALKLQVFNLQKQVRELSITTVALIELLAESSGLDTQVLADRINAVAQEQK